MKIAILVITKNGLKIGYKIKKFFNCDIYTTSKFMGKETKLIDKTITETLSKIYFNYSAFIFVTSTGIAVRVMSSFIKSKDKDPAVIVIDQEGNFVISLLSGHLGGANFLTKKISKILEAIPVITTASDVSGKIAVDTLAMKINSKIESLEDAKKVTSLIIAGENVELKLPGNISRENPSGLILVSNRDEILISKIIPKNIIVGIGCKKGILKENIIKLVKDSFKKKNLSLDSIKCFATVNIKEKEKGILETANYFGKDLKIIRKEDIKLIHHKFKGSDFVLKSIGIYCVSAPAAFLASSKKGKLLIEKISYKGITISIFEEETKNG